MRLTDPVSSVMRSPVITIDKGSEVGEALELMEREGINHLVVTSGDRVVGVVSVRDIMEGLGSSRFGKIPARRIYVSSVMTEPPITIEVNNSIREAIETMLSKGISSLPVIDDGQLAGIVTETDLIRYMDRDDDISGLVKADHPKVMPTDRIVHARNIMLERGARILPVVDQGKLVGLVTEISLAKAFYDIREEIDPTYMDNVARRVLVEDIMVEAPKKAVKGQRLKAVRDLFVKTGLPAIPVVGEDNSVVGVISRKSLLRLLL